MVKDEQLENHQIERFKLPLSTVLDPYVEVTDS